MRQLAWLLKLPTTAKGMKRARANSTDRAQKRRCGDLASQPKYVSDAVQSASTLKPKRVSERIATRQKLALVAGVGHRPKVAGKAEQHRKLGSAVRESIKPVETAKKDAKKLPAKAKSNVAVSKAKPLAARTSALKEGNKEARKSKKDVVKKKEGTSQKKSKEVKKKKKKKEKKSKKKSKKKSEDRTKTKSQKKREDKTKTKSQKKREDKTKTKSQKKREDKITTKKKREHKKTEEVQKRKTKKDELNERRARVKVVPNDQLSPNPNIKVVPKDPMFEVKNEKEIPEVSTFVQCKRSIRAVLTNDMNLLKKLIEDRDLPSVFHKRGVDVPRTALDYAVRTENHAALKLLLTEIDSGRERACLPEVVMKYQSSGRVAFSSSGHQSRNIFLGRGNKEGNNAFTKDTQNANPRHQYIEEVIECGVSLSTIDLILATDPNAEELLFRSIHKIAREGHYKLAGYLVDKARKLSRLGFNKVHQEVLLAERPEDLSPCLTISVKKKAYYEVDKITPVHFAAINPNPKILEKLMSILPEYAIEDDYGLRPIHYAAACEGSGPLEFLLKRGVNPEEKHKGGVTPLMIASKRGRAQNVEVLLKKIEADSEPNEQTGVRRKTAGGNLAIHFAAEGGNVDCVRSLVNHGADIESKMGSYHNKITPLMIATKYGHFELVEALLDMGAVIQQKGMV